MELKLEKQPVSVCELLLDTAAEYPIESDLLLPDYCPDIVRILCCRVQTLCTDCSAEKSVLTVEGMANVTLCYIGDVGGMRKTEYKIPFSKSFELPRDVSSPVCSATVEPGRINCRAVSKRRLELHGVLSIRARLYDTAEHAAISKAQGDGVQLLHRDYPGARLDGQSSHRFSVAEQLSTPVGKEPAVEIVQIDCRPVVQDCRPVAGRAVLKGELLVHLLYKTDPETGALESCDYTLPLSQMFDLPRLTEESRCEARLTCLSADCSVDELDEGIRLEVQLAAWIRCFSPIVLSGATDSFSTLYPTEHTLESLRIPQRVEPIAERVTVRCEAPLPDGAETLLDVWASSSMMAVENRDDKLVLTGRLAFTMLFSGGELGLDSASHSCEVASPLSYQGGDVELLPDIVILSVTGNVLQGKVQLTAELLVTGLWIEFETCQLLTDLTVDEEHPRETDRSVGLVICYASAGESVWDIAKHYGALPEQIMADNGLTEPTLQADTPLMIPTACLKGEA
ncbi:MAG: hypothetical protein DBX44_08225 [Oscillospiraceae bacterium]|nr:MAG: hypothetical protein DBX44_08225 [Oscillospiraceae bacterium]